MSSIDCGACDELRQTSPEFVQNGVTKRVCNSLKNNTGLNPSLSVTHTNDEDLNNANDCLIGRMDQEIEAYEVCDWKTYMHKFIPNLYELIKAMLCSMAGIWSNINRIWCWLESITTSPKTYTVHAYEDDDPSKPAINGFRIADGVVMRPPAPNNGPIRVQARGNIAFITGSLSFNGNMPTSYTNGEEVPWSYLQHGCEHLTNVNGIDWGKNGVCGTEPLVWEIQFKKCQLGFSSLFGRACLYPASQGDFNMRVRLFKKGDEVPPDDTIGRITDPDNPHYGEFYPGWYYFNPADDDMMLLQVRLQNTRTPLVNVTPNGNVDVIACPSSLDC